MNQYSRFSKSLNSLENLFFKLNALDIFESLKICNACRRAVAGLQGCDAGRGVGTGGSCVICIWPRTKIRKIESVNQTPFLAAPTPS